MATTEELRDLFAQLIDNDRREGISAESTADGLIAFAKLGREKVLAISAERDRYRSAWLSARQRAEAYGEGILRHVEDRDTWMGWEKEQAARVLWLAEAHSDALDLIIRLSDERDLLREQVAELTSDPSAGLHHVACNRFNGQPHPGHAWRGWSNTAPVWCIGMPALDTPEPTP